MDYIVLVCQDNQDCLDSLDIKTGEIVLTVPLCHAHYIKTGKIILTLHAPYIKTGEIVLILHTYCVKLSVFVSTVT